MKKDVLIKKQIIKITLILIAFIFTLNSYAGKYIKIKNLKGNWKFSIGDNKNWKAFNFNDSDWDEIYVPSSWEEQGYHGYNGYAWLRREFTISDDYKKNSIYLYLGYIDDVDEVYINGHLIGYTGSFPPYYQTAYNAYRKYHIPKYILNFNSKNVISVRIYDSQQYGGIVKGDIGFYIDPDPLPLDFELHGVWKFNIGDDLNWKEYKINDNEWNNIIVPGSWENQGYRDHDGYGWYRKSIKISEQFANKPVVVVMGKIDDIDEVYINGVLINPIKKLGAKGAYIHTNNYDYSVFRAYFIDGNIFKANATNTIAVRVYDGGGVGGIYEGPVGIIEQSKYVNYWKNKNH